MNKGVVALVIVLVLGICIVGGLALEGFKAKPKDDSIVSNDLNNDVKQENQENTLNSNVEVIKEEIKEEDDYTPPPVADDGPVGPYLKDESVPFEDMDAPDYVSEGSILDSVDDSVDSLDIEGEHVRIVTKGKYNYLRIQSDLFINGDLSDFTSLKINEVEFIESDRLGINSDEGRIVINETGSQSGEELEDISKDGINSYSFIYKGNEYSGSYEVREVD